VWFDIELVSNWIDKLDIGKAVGHDEHLKYCHPIVICLLTKLFTSFISLVHIYVMRVLLIFQRQLLIWIIDVKNVFYVFYFKINNALLTFSIFPTFVINKKHWTRFLINKKTLGVFVSILDDNIILVSSHSNKLYVTLYPAHTWSDSVTV